MRLLVVNGNTTAQWYRDEVLAVEFDTFSSTYRTNQTMHDRVLAESR